MCLDGSCTALLWALSACARNLPSNNIPLQQLATRSALMYFGKVFAVSRWKLLKALVRVVAKGESNGGSVFTCRDAPRSARRLMMSSITSFIFLSFLKGTGWKWTLISSHIFINAPKMSSSQNLSTALGPPSLKRAITVRHPEMKLAAVFSLSASDILSPISCIALKNSGTSSDLHLLLSKYAAVTTIGGAPFMIQVSAWWYVKAGMMMAPSGLLRDRMIWMSPGGVPLSASYSWSAFTKFEECDLLKHPAFILFRTPPMLSVRQSPRRISAKSRSWVPACSIEPDGSKDTQCVGSKGNPQQTLSSKHT